MARRFVTPPASALPRIEKEAALLNALFREASVERFWTGAWERPVEGVAVSGFGVRSVLNGQPRGPHNGADFAAGTGTPILAPAGGVVVYAREFYYSGNTVILDHGFGLYSTMAHLSAFDVKEGARVDPRPAARQGRRDRPGHRSAPALVGAGERRPRRPRVAAHRDRVGGPIRPPADAAGRRHLAPSSPWSVAVDGPRLPCSSAATRSTWRITRSTFSPRTFLTSSSE